MEEKLYTQSDMNAIAAEQYLHVKSLNDRCLNLSLALSRANQSIGAQQKEINDLNQDKIGKDFKKRSGSSGKN